jgi:hypothetical protein
VVINDALEINEGDQFRMIFENRTQNWFSSLMTKVLLARNNSDAEEITKHSLL